MSTPNLDAAVESIESKIPELLSPPYPRTRAALKAYLEFQRGIDWSTCAESATEAELLRLTSEVKILFQSESHEDGTITVEHRIDATWLTWFGALESPRMEWLFDLVGVTR